MICWKLKQDSLNNEFIKLNGSKQDNEVKAQNTNIIIIEEGELLRKDGPNKINISNQQSVIHQQLKENIEPLKYETLEDDLNNFEHYIKLANFYSIKFVKFNFKYVIVFVVWVVWVFFWF